MKLAAYRPAHSYDQLSLRDLLDARDQYHIHLMHHRNVVATAIGLYRIRQKDSWPTEQSEGKVHGTYARTLENSQVRSYSWPAILVFVEGMGDSAERRSRLARSCRRPFICRTAAASRFA